MNLVVTGKGKHGTGQGILKNAVRRYFERNRIEFRMNESHGGYYIVITPDL